MADLPPDIPAYVSIKRELKNQIESGELPEGSRVPSELELARVYGVSRNPTRQALRDLELEGYLVRQPGRGSFVAPASSRQRLLKLAGRRTLVIASPGLEGVYNRKIVGAFISRASEHGFLPTVYFLRFNAEEEWSFLADVRNSGAEGIVFWLQNAVERLVDLLRKFQQSRFPYVLIDRYVRGLESDFVVTNNEEMAYQLTQALLARGHEDVAFITGVLDNTACEDRLSGYRRALREASKPFSAELIGIIDPKGEPVAAVVSRIMAHRRRPTAFFCVNDLEATKLLDELETLGYRVPQDIELATVDDNDIASALGIPMITASQDAREMGRESADMIVARIANPDLPPQQRYLKASICDGLKEAGSRSSSGQNKDTLHLDLEIESSASHKSL